MAYSLFSERPDTAALSPVTPLQAFVRWFADARAKHAQRVALSNLLDYDDALLRDLGIQRDDVISALQYPSNRAGDALSARRARASRDWLSHP
jgi:uncharacterized protein YjiS (DUF1127 family)